MERIFASKAGLNQKVPKLRTVATWWEVWLPPFVCTFKGDGLSRMFCTSFRFLKTDTVDWLSSRIQVSGIRFCWVWPKIEFWVDICAKVKPLVYSECSVES